MVVWGLNLLVDSHGPRKPGIRVHSRNAEALHRSAGHFDQIHMHTVTDDVAISKNLIPIDLFVNNFCPLYIFMTRIRDCWSLVMNGRA